MRKYKKPVLNVEQFTANEFIAACGDSVTEYYLFKCDAGNDHSGNVYEDTNKNGTYDFYADKNLTFGFFTSYKACKTTHLVKKGEEDGVFSQGWFQKNGSTKKEPVVIWKGENNDNVHATSALINQIETHKGNFS